MDRIKRHSDEVLVDHKSKFGEDFADNKKALEQVSIVRSKGLKNEIAGHITKFIKKEIREEKAKQARITASKSEQQVEEQSEIELTKETVTEEAPDTVVDVATEEAPDTVVDVATEEAPDTVVDVATEEAPSETKEKIE